MTRHTGGEAGDSSAPVWTAAAVARRLGVSPATLRSWGARYGVGPPGHQAGRYRRYSSVDVAELDMMRRLHGQGVPMATAASIARDRHRGADPRAESDPGTAGGGRAGTEPEPGSADDAPPDEVGALVRAARRLDGDAAVRALQDNFARRGVVETWDQVCRPALARTAFGAGSADGAAPTKDEGPDPTATIDAECVLVWAVTTSLRRLPAPPPAPPDAGLVLLACGERELHTLAMDALLAALDEKHVAARTLGPSVPTAALLHASDQIRPAAVFVWAQVPGTAHLDVLRDLRPHSGAVVAAGPGWGPRALPGGVRPAHGLVEAVDLARRAVHASPAHRGQVTSRPSL
ncbi:MerR family transcriptional regulator [Pseudonocardia sp. KRD291]|uniref:MerR family transcriptional regulator n=1 Tax=Pseudonocardia sp. KRD291 TaxID=2792007 RepID=UPI001C49EA3A|nr:MerR family transcriptional regulator [Pseudonocardia sp. KRD291]MBW0104386.1 MerR family transcriptional regulator [Pseudonocardia sp. KRD291]